MLVCAAAAAQELKDPTPLSESTGTQAKSSKSSKEFSPFPPQTRWTLALNNALVSAPAYEGTSGYFPIEGDRIAAYDLDAGTLRWIAPVRAQSAPVPGDGLLFVSSPDALVALNLEDGAVTWQVPMPERVVAPLAWEEGWLIAATRTSLLAVRPADGMIAWHRDIPAPATAAPVVASNRIFLPVDDGRVLAFDVETGRDLWARRLGAAPTRIDIVGERLLAGSHDDYLYCLSTRDGSVQWRWRTGADVVSAPIADAHRIYFVSLDNVLRAVNQRNGVQQWKRPLTFRPEWGPVIAADTVIVSGLGGPIRAFYMKDGTPAGELTLDAGAEAAGQPYTFDRPATLGPVVVTVTRSLESGTMVTTSSRSIEPPMLKTLGPLPGLTRMGGPPAQR